MPPATTLAHVDLFFVLLILLVATRAFGELAEKYNLAANASVRPQEMAADMGMLATTMGQSYVRMLSVAANSWAHYLSSAANTENSSGKEERQRGNG